MQSAVRIKSRISIVRPSLVDTITELHAEFASIKGQLSHAQREIARLRRELARCRPVTRTQLDLASLRRGVAFYCHPDRGGDAGVMQGVNSLFDSLERVQSAHHDSTWGGPVA